MLLNCSLVSQQMPSIEAPENLPVLILMLAVSVHNVFGVNKRHWFSGLFQSGPNPVRMP